MEAASFMECSGTFAPCPGLREYENVRTDNFGGYVSFEWDAAKARRNLAKHGIDFEVAEQVWDDPLHVIVFDRVEQGQERWHAIGRVGSAVVLVVVHAYPDPDNEDHVRIIGARKATWPERRGYEEGDPQP